MAQTMTQPHLLHALVVIQHDPVTAAAGFCTIRDLNLMLRRQVYANFSYQSPGRVKE